jgi:hypothetical protein
METLFCEIRNTDSGIHGSLVLNARIRRVYLDSSGCLGTRKNSESDVSYGCEKFGGLLRWSLDIPVESVSNLKRPLWLVEIAKDTFYHCFCVVSIGCGPEGHKQFERAGICRIEGLRLDERSRILNFIEYADTKHSKMRYRSPFADSGVPSSLLSDTMRGVLFDTDSRTIVLL